MDDRRRRREAGRELEAMIDAAFASFAASPPPPTWRSSAPDDPLESATVRPAEPRTILVDGFNVLHATLDAEARKAGWWRRVWREDLLRRVALWPGELDSIWVAFDGTQPAWSCWAEPVAADVEPRSAPHVHSVYVESADDWIVRRARRAERPAATIVVSRDRQVAGRARSAGCEVWSPSEFLSRCPDPPEAEPTG